MDVDGAIVFGRLLYLTGHPESAQPWWQLAAGAGSRAAAYCLHLHHLCLGESQRGSGPALVPPAHPLHGRHRPAGRPAADHEPTARLPEFVEGR